MTATGPNEGRPKPDLTCWREFAIDGEFFVACAGMRKVLGRESWVAAVVESRDARSLPKGAGTATRRELIAAGSNLRPDASLLVRATYEQDGSAAASVGVWLELDDAPPLGTTAITGTDGTALFESLPAGKVGIRLQDGGAPARQLELQPGRRHEVAVVIPRGIDVHGVVVDTQGTPVADAEVLVTWHFARITFAVARSGPDGTFRLRSLSRLAMVGGRSALAGTSDFVHVDSAQRASGEPARIRLVLPGSPV